MSKPTIIIIVIWVFNIALWAFMWDDITSVSRFNRKQEMELRYLQIQKLELEVELLRQQLNNKQP